MSDQNFFKIPIIKKKDGHWILSDKSKTYGYQIIKEQDAMALPSNMVTIQNPKILDVIKDINENNKDLFNKSELLNLTIIAKEGGFGIYIYGIGNKDLADLDLLNGFISALSGLFNIEIKYKFNSILIENYQDQRKFLYIYISEHFIITTLLDKNLFSNLSKKEFFKKYALEMGYEKAKWLHSSLGIKEMKEVSINFSKILEERAPIIENRIA